MTTHDKPRNSGAWTESRYRSFITSALRSAFRRWPPKFQVLKGSATERRVNPKSGKLAMFYLCAGCGDEFPAKEVQVDHVAPVVAKSFVSWDVFIERLYCEPENLQVLCKGCHAIKTKAERAARTRAASSSGMGGLGRKRKANTRTLPTVEAGE